MHRFLFFLRYYFKKHTGTLTADDRFRKYYYRMHKKAGGTLLADTGSELLYRHNQLTCSIRKKHSDIHVFTQVFCTEEYKPLIDEIKKRGLQHDINFIVDAGANVGYTSLYLKQYFKDALLIAIEPDGHNVQAIQKNISLNHVENTEVVQAGLWSKDTWLELVKPGTENQDWAFYVKESAADTGLQGITLDTLLKNFDQEAIDILKMDIEGGETVLFSDAEKISPVLEKTKFLAMEIHDDDADRNHIEKILSRFFRIYHKGELTIGVNRRLVK